MEQLARMDLATLVASGNSTGPLNNNNNDNNDNNNNNNNNKKKKKKKKIWILVATSAYSFDEPKFISARKKRKEKENNKQKHQNLQCIIFLTKLLKHKL